MNDPLKYQRWCEENAARVILQLAGKCFMDKFDKIMGQLFVIALVALAAGLAALVWKSVL